MTAPLSPLTREVAWRQPREQSSAAATARCYLSKRSIRINTTAPVVLVEVAWGW